jgi:transcriptional regulator with XRE-family HTH domain
MNTNFKNTAEAAAQLSGKLEMKEAVEREIRQSTLVSMLVEMRLDKQKSQEEVATSMGCDPSKISRMESCSDSQLRLNDIMGYTSALGIQVSVMFDDSSMPASARVKQCVFQIDKDLKKLAQLAQEQDGDEEIANKISRFYREVLVNFLLKFAENREKLCNFVPLKMTDPHTEQTDESAVGTGKEESPA